MKTIGEFRELISISVTHLVQIELKQGCQGYGPRAGPGPTVLHIRPAGDKGRIYFLILFIQIFQILFFSNFRWNPSVGLLLLRLSCSSAGSADRDVVIN